MGIAVTDISPADDAVDVSVDSDVVSSLYQYRSAERFHIAIGGGAAGFGTPTTFNSLTKCTWNLWVEDASITDAEPFFFKGGSGGGGYAFFIGSGGSNSLAVRLGTAGPSNFSNWNSGAGGLSTTGRNHVVVVYDGTQTGDANRLKIYINEVAIVGSFSEDAVPAALPSSSNTVVAVGGSLNGLGAFDVYVDDAAVWPGQAASPSQALEMADEDGFPSDLNLISLGPPTNWIQFDGDLNDFGTGPTWTGTEFPTVSYATNTFYTPLEDDFYVQFVVDGGSPIDVIIEGVFQTGYTGTADVVSLGSIDLSITPDDPFPPGVLVEVSVGRTGEDPDFEWSFTTEAVDAIDAGRDGGGPFTVNSTSLSAGIYKMYIGTLQTDEDPEAYNGNPGSGNPNYVEFVTVDGGVQATKVYFPPMELGVNNITVYPVAGGDPTVLDVTINSYPPTYRSRTLLLRRILPPWYKTGPKFPENEKPE